MEEAKATIKFLSENSGTISIASLASAGSVIFGWTKIYSKFIANPIKGLTDSLASLSEKSRQNDSSNETKFKEFDNSLESQDSRIKNLEKEDKDMIHTLQITQSKMDEFATNFDNHKEKFTEVSLIIKNLQVLDTQRQVAISRIQTLLEVFGK